jgi:hypothetical protein
MATPSKVKILTNKLWGLGYFPSSQLPKYANKKMIAPIWMGMLISASHLLLVRFFLSWLSVIWIVVF